MQEMKSQAALPTFGSVYELTKPDWEQQVTRAPEGVWVLIVLYQNQ